MTPALRAATGCALAAAGLIAAVLSEAKSEDRAQAPQRYKPPHTEFGDPDLQGLWTNASITTLERPYWASKLELTPEEAVKAEAEYKAWLARIDSPTEASRGVGGYNSFWLDPGSKFGVVHGEIRTSWIVDPPTGRVPYSAEGAREAMAAGTKQFGDFSGPEVRSLGERCIVGYGSTSGPPMLNVLYNNNYQVVQSPGYVVIVVEMNHDARIIRLGGRHLPANIRPWMGDSIGHWEGDTLVAETTNLNRGQNFTADIRHRLYLPADSKVTERFTRVADDTILYDFQVEEPRAYTQTWRGEIPMHATKGPIYEYACHEGNYSLSGILAGARTEEERAASARGGSR
jgi:hypothetical protein